MTPSTTGMVSLKCVLVLSLLVSLTDAYDGVPHRHRHAKAHGTEYNLERLMNRLDSHITTQTPTTEGTVTEPNPEPGNSLWDDDLTLGGTSTLSPLDGERWDKILNEKEKQREDHEDAEDELEEKNEEEGFEDQKEQAESYKPWNSRSGESSYTNWKWDNLGNRKSVDNLFQIYRSGPLNPDSTNKEAQYEVYKHNKQMSREALCRVPRPKVIKVLDVYPSTSKLYVPACTVLHQCGDDTGCCGGSAQRCGPKTSKRVELYFYTTYIVSSHSRQRTSSGLDKLPFYNHTECECQDRLEEVMPRDGQNTEFSGERNSESGCKCPSEYTVRRLANGSCTCDCFDRQRDCIKYKRGKEYFNHNDRLCIEMGTCQLPACDFGGYLRSAGRCPRKHEKYRTWSRYH